VGWVKIAEVLVDTGVTEIYDADIRNCTGTLPGVETTLWTAEKSDTYRNDLSLLNASLPVFTNANKELVSNLITGIGNVVMSNSPTFIGTMIIAALTASGLITANGGVTLGAGSNLIGSATSGIAINTNKFTVDGATGDTSLAGNLNANGKVGYWSTYVILTQDDWFHALEAYVPDNGDWRVVTATFASGTTTWWKPMTLYRVSSTQIILYGHNVSGSLNETIDDGDGTNMSYFGFIEIGDTII